MKTLTNRQREVLLLVAKGRKNFEIAKELIITEHTVKAHLGILYERLHANSRVQVTVNAMKKGIISLDEI